MTPFPTLDDVHATSANAECCAREWCFGPTARFTCASSGGESKNAQQTNPTDMSTNGDRDGHTAESTPPPNTEDQEIVMSLDRLFCPFSRQCGDSCGRSRSALTMVRRNKSNGSQPIFYTDVVVVGNGPSALALSSFLAGYRPFYDGATPHPDGSLHEKLEIDKSKSLLEQDLGQLCEGLEGRTSHQVSLLYDYLVRPEADIGQEIPSTLTWRRDESIDKRRPSCRSGASTSVPHVVLGKGAVGGTWADLAPEVMTLSFASWLDLPAYSFRQWLERDGANFATDLQMKIDATRLVVGRVPCAAVRRYYRDYVRGLGLEENIFEYSLVTSVRKRRGPGDQNPDPDCDQDPEYGWDVHGCYSGGSFHFRCRRVVLATGVTVPRQLGVDGEDDSRVLHTSAQLDRAIPELLSSNSNNSEYGYRKRAAWMEEKRIDPVLVIGDGLNAADAVIKCLINGIPVVHSFRKTPKDSKQILSKLSKVLYPEYHTVYQLMTGAAVDSLYSVHARSQAQRFEFSTPDGDRKIGTGGVAVLRNIKTSSVENIRFSRVAVLIGFEADLSFLNVDKNESIGKGKLSRDGARAVDSKSNTVNVDPITRRCIDEPDLYAVGPLIGDNFVRYVVGGSMAVASDIVRRQ